MNTYFVFETGQENKRSEEFGPYPFVQLTYDELRVGPSGNVLAVFQEGLWQLRQSEAAYSDVIIYSKEENQANGS